MATPGVRWSLMLAGLLGGCGVSVDATRSPDGGADPADDGGPASGCAALAPLPASTPSVYVSPVGDDAAPGTAAAPLRSLGEAARRLPSGGTVWVGGGVYGAQTLAGRGTATNPLVIRAVAGAAPVFEGAAITDTYSGVITMSIAEHVVFAGLEIRGCDAPECTAFDAPAVIGLTVRDCHLHDLNGAGMRFAGAGIRLEHNDVHDVALVNRDNAAGSSGWPYCIGTVPNRDTPSTPTTSDVIIRGNRVASCWGEGIGVWFSRDVVVEDNQVTDPWNVGIYLDNSHDVTIQRNFVRTSRGLFGDGAGILMSTEPYPGWGLPPQATRAVAITNNVVVGGGIGWWRSDATGATNTYRDVAISHNTIVASTDALGFGRPASGAPAPTGCAVRNNLVVARDPSELADPAGWAVAGNAWVNHPRPAFADDTDAALTLDVPPITDASAAAGLAPLAGAGVTGASVADDFACAARDPAAPRRGAFER